MRILEGQIRSIEDHLSNDCGGGFEVDLVVLDTHGQDPPEGGAKLLKYVGLQLGLLVCGRAASLRQPLYDRRTPVVL